MWSILLITAASAREDWARAVVRIGGCSGVCVSPEGLILTARHCEFEDRQRVYFSGGKEVLATRLLSSRNGDGPVAFVCDGGGYPFLPVAKVKPEAGDPVSSYGFPLRDGKRPLEFDTGTMQSGGRYELDGREFLANLTTIKASPGWSGGPLLNARGEVLGLCSNGDGETTAFTSWASTRHAYEQAQPLARELILGYSRSEVVIFTTPGCSPCERLKADIRAGHFTKWKMTLVEYEPGTGLWSDTALKDEFLSVAQPERPLNFPVIWVRKSTRYRSGYDPAQRRGLIGFIEHVLDGLARIVVGERPSPEFPIDVPPPAGTPSLQPSPVVEASLASVERLKVDVAKTRADLQRLQSLNPLEKLRGVVALKSDLATLKADAAEIRDEARGDPRQLLWGLLGIVTGVLHRRFAV